MANKNTEDLGFGDRLRVIRQDRGWTQQELANAIGGTKPSVISNYENEHHYPNALWIQRFVKATGADVEWLIHGGRRTSDTNKQPEEQVDDSKLLRLLRKRLRTTRPVDSSPVMVWQHESNVAPHEALEQYRTVPLMRDAAAAGHGRVVEEQVEGWAVIHASVVPDGHEVRAVRVEGDSMTPLLPSGTIVAVDFDMMDPREADGRVVAARRDEDVVIKWWRLRDDHISLESQNPAYPPIYLTGEEADRALLGRVVWAWQDFREVTQQ